LTIKQAYYLHVKIDVSEQIVDQHCRFLAIRREARPPARHSAPTRLESTPRQSIALY